MTKVPLYDELHAWCYGPPPYWPNEKQAWDQACYSLRTALRQSKRFILDDAFIRQAVIRSHQPTQQLISLCNLSHVPFDRAWIEYSLTARLDAMFKLQETGSGYRVQPDVDGLDFHGEFRGPAGFLLERENRSEPSKYRVTACYYRHHPKERTAYKLDVSVPLCVHAYDVDLQGRRVPYTFPYTPKDAEDYARALSHYAWAAGDLEDELWRRGGTMLEPRFGPMWMRNVPRPDVTLRDEVATHAGDLRFLMSILSLINTCPIERHHFRAEGHDTRPSGRRIDRLDSEVITIRCGRKRIETVVDRAFRAAIRGMRRHDVRGHWAVHYADYGKGAACDHMPVDLNGRRAFCPKCQRRLIWIDQYEKGDEALGRVYHTYIVKD